MTTWALIILINSIPLVVSGLGSEQICKTVGKELVTKLAPHIPAQKLSTLTVICQRTDGKGTPNVGVINDGATPSIKIITDE